MPWKSEHPGSVSKRVSRQLRFGGKETREKKGRETIITDDQRDAFERALVAAFRADYVYQPGFRAKMNRADELERMRSRRLNLEIQMAEKKFNTAKRPHMSTEGLVNRVIENTPETEAPSIEIWLAIPVGDEGEPIRLEIIRIFDEYGRHNLDGLAKGSTIYVAGYPNVVRWRDEQANPRFAIQFKNPESLNVRS